VPETRRDHTSAAPFSMFGVVGLLVGVIVVYGVFYELDLLMNDVIPSLRELPVTDLRRTIVQTLLGFTGMGCLMMVLSTRWQTVAWQAAISVTIVAAAIDWQRDLLERGGIDLPEIYRTLYVVAMAGASILFVHVWQRRANPRLMSLFLFAACVLMGIGYQMGLGWSDIWWGNPEAEAEAAAGGRGASLWEKFRGEIIVHSIFTALFVISVCAAVRERRRGRGQLESLAIT
jgi:hypothetical protein